ncbi:MAG: tetratricopeptide repeat protein, partial [Leptolyngbyaceae cyanobacterium MO_188.B28]|nr:tetratricopeptide repeat protein [Leptolyngbyaceae cyanobacterium MO_188.B28]
MKQNRWVSFVFTPLMILDLTTGHLPPIVTSSPAQNSPNIVLTQANDTFKKGLIAYRHGQLLEAIQHWENALTLYESPLKQAQTLGNLAIAYRTTGQYISALEANQAALDIFVDLEMEAAIGQVRSNLGNVYVKLGAYDKAIAAYQYSLSIAQATEDRIAEGVIIGNLGLIEAEQGNQAAALEAYEESLA